MNVNVDMGSILMTLVIRFSLGFGVCQGPIAAHNKLVLIKASYSLLTNSSQRGW